MSDQVVFWRGDYLANKILEQQDRIDELERKIAAQALANEEQRRVIEAKTRTIDTLALALAESARQVDVPSLTSFMGLVDVREEVGS